jgi:prevent-host-death family protein
MNNQEEPRKADIERIPSSDARDRLTELLNRAAFKGERFILTRNGEDIAAIVPASLVEAA